MKTRHRLGFTLGAGAALSGIIPLGSEQTYESPQPPTTVVEQGFTQDVTKLAGAVIRLCDSAPSGVQRQAATLSCDIPLPSGGHYQAAVTETSPGPDAGSNAAVAPEVSFGLYGVPLSANQNFDFRQEVDDGQWVIREGAPGYPTLTLLTPLGSNLSTQTLIEIGLVRDDALATLAEAERLLGPAAAGVATPSPEPLSNVCGEPSVCS